MANGVVKPPPEGAKTRSEPEKAKAVFAVGDMRSALNAYFKTKGLEPLSRGTCDAETKERYGALKNEYEECWGQKLGDQDFYGILVRESKFIYAPFAKIRLFFAERSGIGEAEAGARGMTDAERGMARQIVMLADANDTAKNINSARPLVMCGMFSDWTKRYLFKREDYRDMLANANEYARRYGILRQNTTADIYSGYFALPNALKNVENAVANFNMLKDGGYVESMNSDTEYGVGMNIGNPPEAFRKFLEGEGKELFRHAGEKKTYKTMINERKMSYFHRYMENLIEENRVPDEKLAAYYKGIPLPGIRANLESGEIRGQLEGAVWMARDIGLAEAYISGFVKGIKMKWSDDYYAGCGVIVEFRKDAIEREFKLGYGQTGGGELVNEVDARKPGGATVIPFNGEYVARVLAYEESVHREISEKLAGTGIEVVLMSPEVASEYMERNAYLQLGSTPEENRRLAKAKELAYKEDHAGSVAECDAVLAGNPECVEARLSKASALIRLEKRKEAAGECRAAIKAGPLNPRAYCVLGRAVEGEMGKVVSNLEESLRKRERGGRLAERASNYIVEQAASFIVQEGGVKEARSGRTRDMVDYCLRDIGGATSPESLASLGAVFAEIRAKGGSREFLAAIDIVESIGKMLREGDIEDLASFDSKKFGGSVYKAAKLLEAGDAGGLKRMFPNDDPQKLIEFWRSNKEADGVALAMEYLRAYPLREQ